MEPTKTGIFPGRDTATGAYSPGIAVGEMVYVSGQGPLDPATGAIQGSRIEEQTELTLNIVRRILQAAGCEMDDCVKVTVHLKEIGEFDRFNATYARFFSQPYPARTTVQSVLWGGILIEVDAIAVGGCARGK
jgi:2-iminobutanoate/2-iminopropanoate deaminase